MKIYISGPITGIDEAKCKAAFNVAVARLFLKGYEAVSPWHISQMLPPSFTYEDYMEIDMVLLKKCDAILMLPGWENSKGATKELTYAKKNDMKVFFDINEIKTKALKINTRR